VIVWVVVRKQSPGNHRKNDGRERRFPIFRKKGMLESSTARGWLKLGDGSGGKAEL